MFDNLKKGVKFAKDNNPSKLPGSLYGLGRDLAGLAKSSWQGKVLKDKLKEQIANKKPRPNVESRTREDLRGL